MRVPPTTSRNGSQMTTSSRIGAHKTFHSTPSRARLPGGISQNVRYSMQRTCQTFQMISGCNSEHLL
ncbi:hypothetical protein TNCV_4814401 [Trichonephila clavipes]|nr:hypothetical protein TNCV_4814401 [Trichonephila clavipes]